MGLGMLLNMKKVRLIAPFPPPLNGHSYMAEHTREILKKKFNLSSINLHISSPKILIAFKNVFKLLLDSFVTKTTYLTISESFWGNIKDLIFYLILYFQRKKIVIHLHGGSIKKELWNKWDLLFQINKFFIRQFKAVIVSSDSHKEIFSFMPNNKVFVVNNFADDELKIPESSQKDILFEKEKIKIFYCSGMRKLKGYEVLYKAYLQIPKKYNKNLEIHFAGPFEKDEEKKEFLNVIKNLDNVIYHGFISDEKKVELFKQAHIFCFPSLYNEGQPISIIEALYSGCAIIASHSDGLSDMLDQKSCLFIEKGDSSSLAKIIEDLYENRAKILDMMIYNKKLSKAYDKSTFSKKIINILEM